MPDPQVADFLTGDMVMFLNGPGVLFKVHEKLICYHSRYFRKLLQGDFKGAQAKEKTVNVSDISTATATKFFNWIYSSSCTLDIVTKPLAVPESYSDFIALYCFADQYDVPRLRTELLTAIYKTRDSFPKRMPTFEAIIKAYNKLPGSSPLLDLIVDICAHGYTGDSITTDTPGATGLPTEFVLALLKALAIIRRYECYYEMGDGKRLKDYIAKEHKNEAPQASGNT